ncbi:MAG: HAD family phosphatase [Bacteroidales bacterium]
MIRNIVFDLGNVLLNWNPEQHFIRKGLSHEEREVILSEVFRAPEWPMLDNGDLSLWEAVERISVRSTLNTDQILAAFNSRLEILFPLDFNIKLLPGLKKAGFKLYYLSNFPEDIFDEVTAKNSFFTLFDGGIISARVRLSKPDPEIFRHLAGNYNLEYGETLFIDDIKTNVDAAVSLGMKGIHLKDQTGLRAHLEELLGIVIPEY